MHILQQSILTLPHSSLPCLYQCHGVSQLPRSAEVERDKKSLKPYPLGYLHIDIIKVRTAEGKVYLFVATDRTSKFIHAELHPMSSL